jgi:hypothetical protein
MAWTLFAGLTVAGAADEGLAQATRRELISAITTRIDL